jgi:hypothetical protein
MWIQILLGLLSLLLQWFLNKKTTGYTDRQRRFANYILSKMEEIRQAAADSGLKPDGQDSAYGYDPADDLKNMFETFI